MSHEPVLSTDLFEDIDGHLKPLRVQTKSFNLLEFLCLRGEFQAVIDIYGACNGWILTKQPTRPKISRLRDRDEERLEKLIQLHLKLSNFDEKDDHWAGFALSAIGLSEQARVILERSFNRGYVGSATLLAILCQRDKKIQQAGDYLKLLEPFDKLDLWDRALAYRESGRLFEYNGDFELAKEHFEKSWNITKQLGNGGILISLCAHLLAWSYEGLGKSEHALKIIREAKPYMQLVRKVQSLYLQTLAAVHIKHFDEARGALAELQTFRENDPHLTSLIHHAQAIFAYCEGRTIDAISHFMEAIHNSEGTKTEVAFFAYLYLVNCSIRLKNLDEAEKYLDQAEHEHVKMDVGGWLPPAHLERARAALLLHRGILDVAIGRSTAVDNLEASLEIFGEFGLNRERSQALLTLAAWYLFQQDRLKASRYVVMAYQIKTQDLTALEAILEMFPGLKKLYDDPTSQDQFKSIAGREIDYAAREIGRLFSSRRHRYAIEGSRAIFVPKPAAKLWMGLSCASSGLNDLAKVHWNISPEMKRHAPQLDATEEMREEEAVLDKLHYLSTSFLSTREHARNALLRFSVLGRVHLSYLNANFEQETITFSNLKTYALLALFVENFRKRQGVKLEKILQGLWPKVEKNLGEKEFNHALEEINVLGERLLGTEFAIENVGGEVYKLERIGISNLKESEHLSIAYLPLELEEHLGQCDELSIWCLEQYKTFFPDLDLPWVNERRQQLESALRQELFVVSQRSFRKGEEQIVFGFVKNLVTLEPGHADWQTTLGKKIKRLANKLNRTHHAPGEWNYRAFGRFTNEEAFRTLQESCFQDGWLLISKELVNERASLRLNQANVEATAHGLDALDFVGKDKAIELLFVSTKYVFEHEKNEAYRALMLHLEQHEISELSEEQR